jgi:hypothetical protein
MMCISLSSVFCILKIHCLDQSAYQHSLSPQAYSLSQHIPLRARPLPRACTTRDGAIFHMGSTLAPHVLLCCVRVLLEIVTFFFRPWKLRLLLEIVTFFFRPWKLRHELLLRVTFFLFGKIATGDCIKLVQIVEHYEN